MRSSIGAASMSHPVSLKEGSRLLSSSQGPQDTLSSSNLIMWMPPLSINRWNWTTDVQWLHTPSACHLQFWKDLRSHLFCQAYKPPSAYQLSGTLVNKNYGATKATIDRIIKDSPSIDLIIDESSTIGGHRVINVSVQNIYIFSDSHWKKVNGARDIDFDRLLEVQDSPSVKRPRAFIHKRYAYRTLPLLLARYWTLYVSLPLRFVNNPGLGGSMQFRPNEKRKDNSQQTSLPHPRANANASSTGIKI
jgi:hypothetical protein